jgi:putative DNA primase/helicase
MTIQNDNNPYLLRFNNGVVDFNTKKLRGISTKDRCTKSTKINYIPLDRTRDAVVIAEIDDFIETLFPTLSQRDYMWEHFASILIGVNLNCKLHVYAGIGSKGKGVLTDLLTQCLGDYCSNIPSSIITEPRDNFGEASPDLIALNGVRLALVHEPRVGDTINNGALKQLTGVETIKGRHLFSAPVTFKPQCKVIVTSDNIMKVEDDIKADLNKIVATDFDTLFTDYPGYHERICEKLPKWREVFAAMLVDIAFTLPCKVK